MMMSPVTRFGEGEEVRVSADSDVLDEGNDYWVSMDVPESMLESLWA